ncbi:MAG: hypothetical protein KKB03_04230 [Nanoarchaeota archaeon]|nr:hypothetical protein [Nanoarchaeota archaeon]MBU1135403.1 hypothetical protein [Nanoarchaeota archaeon]MBU2520421.1 hypothetical protein [Nanoarchaeota archaeon]
MDRYSKFILSMIAVGIWVLAFAIFFQPTPIEAYGAQEVKIVGWSTDDIVKVDLKKIGGMTHWVALPIPVEVRE